MALPLGAQEEVVPETPEERGLVERMLAGATFGAALEYAQWNLVFDEEIFGDSRSTREPWVYGAVWGEGIRIGPLGASFRVATDGLGGSLAVDPQAIRSVAERGFLMLQGALDWPIPALRGSLDALGIPEALGWGERGGLDLDPRLEARLIRRNFRWTLTKGPAFSSFWNTTLTWIDGQGDTRVLTDTDVVTHDSEITQGSLGMAVGPVYLGFMAGAYTSPNEVYLVWPTGDLVLPQVAENVLVVMRQEEVALVLGVDLLGLIDPAAEPSLRLDTVFGSVRPVSAAFTMDREFLFRIDGHFSWPLRLGPHWDLEAGAFGSWSLLGADSLEDWALTTKSMTLGATTIPSGQKIDASYFRGDIWWGVQVQAIWRPGAP